LVSLETHTNLYFNWALLSMLGVEPQADYFQYQDNG
jgi:hypothetical protein